MKHRSYTIEYQGFRAAVLKTRRSKWHPYMYEVVPVTGYFIHENTVVYATDDVFVAREYARLYGQLY